MMKRTIKCLWSFLFIIYFLSGCQPGKGETDPGNLIGSDNQHQFSTTAYSWKLAESDSYYYHIADNFLYSISKDDGKVRVLDNNPETLDDLETDPVEMEKSNAFFYNPRSVQYINSKLYVLASAKNELAFDSTGESTIFEDCIYEVDPAGGGQKKIYQAEKFLYDAIIHRGYIYFSTSEAWAVDEQIEAGDLTEEDMAELTYQVERVPLDSPNQKAEIIYQQKGAKGVVTKMRAYGDYLHFVESPRRADDFAYRHMIYDLNTLEIKSLADGEMNISDPVAVTDGLVYKKYRATDQEAPEVDLVKTKFDGSKTDEFLLESTKGYGYLYGYGDLFCLDTLPYVLFGLEEERILQFMNLDGEHVADIHLPDQSGLILGMNADYLFIEVQASVDTKITHQPIYQEIYRLDLNRIRESDLAFEPFFTYQPPA